MGKKRISFLLVSVFVFSALTAQTKYKPKELLYGVAYYYEYMPTERLDEDVRMMKEYGINFDGACGFERLPF